MVSYLSRLDKFGVAPHAPRSWSVISPDQTSLGWPQTCPARGRSSLLTRQVWCGPTRAQLVVGHLSRLDKFGVAPHAPSSWSVIWHIAVSFLYSYIHSLFMYSLLLTCWNNLAKFGLAPSGLRVLNLLTPSDRWTFDCFTSHLGGED